MKVTRLLIFTLVICLGIAQAATQGTLNLSGTVGSVNQIIVTTEPAATALDIEGGETDLLIATVSESSNNPGGFSIEITSTNGGELQHTQNASYNVEYYISYDGGGFSIPGTTSTSPYKTTGPLTQLYTHDSDLKIQFTGLSNAPAGAYTDTLQITIIAD